MAGEWQRVRAADIATHMAAGPFGSAIGAKYFRESGVPIIRGSNLSNEVGIRLSDDGLVFLQEEKAAEFKRSEAKQGDLIFTCWGTIDQVGLVDDRARYPRYIVSNKQMLLSPDPQKAHSLFLYYFFSSPRSREEILNQGIGSSVPGFNLGQLRTFQVFLPPLLEQKRIAHILGTLDDKIELNRRMNATLEAMSRALFNSWFVDFDPVRQKAADKQPVGMDAQTAALFPDSFEDSEIGEVPKGWRAGVVGEHADLNPESWSKATYPDEVRYVDLSSTKWGEVEATEKYGRESAPSRAQRILRPGDTIFGTVRPGNGSFAMVDEDGLTGSTGFAVLRPKPRACREYVYLATTTSHNVDRLAHLADGGAYPAVRPEVVADTPLVSAPPTVVMMFSERISGCFDRIAKNRRESRTLAALRDTLLPKLLSGEIRVPEAEEAVEEAIA
jgi:type I restriction enzyme S subunit